VDANDICSAFALARQCDTAIKMEQENNRVLRNYIRELKENLGPSEGRGSNNGVGRGGGGCRGAKGESR
jgi:hypothetical protein